MRCRGRPRLLYITDSSSSREVARTRGGEDERLEREGTAFDDPFSLETPLPRIIITRFLASLHESLSRASSPRDGRPRVVSSSCPARARARRRASFLDMACVQNAFEGFFVPRPSSRGDAARALHDALELPELPPSAALTLSRLRLLALLKLALGAWFSTRLATRGDAPLYLGSAALALLESALLLRAALTPDGRALAPVANLAAASRLFLVLAAAKAYAAMYASRADAADVACFGVAAYLSHVQALALQSLERVLLTSPVLLARLRQEERRREEEEATVPKTAATGPWFFTPEEGVGAVADEARNRPEGEPAPKRTSTPSDASANASTARDRVGAEGRSSSGGVEMI